MFSPPSRRGHNPRGEFKAPWGNARGGGLVLLQSPDSAFACVVVIVCIYAQWGLCSFDDPDWGLSPIPGHKKRLPDKRIKGRLRDSTRGDTRANCLEHALQLDRACAIGTDVARAKLFRSFTEKGFSGRIRFAPANRILPTRRTPW